MNHPAVYLWLSNDENPQEEKKTLDQHFCLKTDLERNIK
jgi:hypothetical protein